MKRPSGKAKLIVGSACLLLILGAIIALQTNAASSTPQKVSTLAVGANNTAATTPKITADTSTQTTSSAPSTPPTSYADTDSSSSNSGASTSTSVSVNGQPVAVPANGTVQKSISSPNGQTNVTVSNNQSVSSNTSSSDFHQSVLNVTTSTSATTDDNSESP
jgi:hypothetical protein